ncbi:MAG: choice-of-anchor D domain-containing protein [Acidobacteriota bacterium]
MKISANNKGMFARPLVLFLALIAIVSVSRWYTTSEAASAAKPVFAGDNCATATVIAPSALPFTEDSNSAGAANDVDPTAIGCVPGGGSDVVYAFTPNQTSVYSIGVTPFSTDFDASLYVVTDCANPTTTCVGGANANGPGRGEALGVSLSSGTTYYVVVDTASAAGSGGPFHFSLRKNAPANDSCASPTIIEGNRLPFVANGSTVGATNDLNPQTPCLRSRQSGSGAEVIYQYTSVDSQNYIITVTPVGNFDVTLYVVTNCASLANCTSSDIGGAGDAEEVRRTLVEGSTYYIVVDGFGFEAGDFNITVSPSIPQAPAAPTNLTAVASNVGGQLKVDLNWVDNSNNELGFRIERSFDAQVWTEIATVGPNVTSYSDTTVSPNTLYFYRVFAFNNFGNSDPTNIADATTPAPPPPPQGVISVSPISIDFGTVRSPITQTVTISNLGGADLQITQITDPAAPFSIVDKPGLPLTIAPGQSTQLTVRFAPVSSAMSASSFTISSNDPVTPTVTVNLRGQGSVTPVPNLELTSGVIDFPGGSSTFLLEIKNTGDADLVIASIFRPTAPFFISGEPALPATFKPGEGFFLTVAFSPTAVGVFQTQMTLITNDPDSLLSTIHVRGTSTATLEQMKLRVPSFVTAVAGGSVNINVLAVNGTNTDIHLSTVGATQGGTFTDSGSGKGTLSINVPTDSTGRFILNFRATDSANRVKTAQTVVTVLAAADTHTVSVTLTPPETASNPPTGVFALDQSLTPLGIAQSEAITVQPQVAAGLAGYLVYRAESPNVSASTANLVGVIASGQTSFIDRVPYPSTSSKVFYYRLTALYVSSTESAASEEATTAPRIINGRYKKKQLLFNAAGSNIAVGAVAIVKGTESFPLVRSGDLIIVERTARSTPGNRLLKGFVDAGTTVQIRNPNGATSATFTVP